VKKDLKKYYNEKIRLKGGLTFEQLPKKYISNIDSSLGFVIWKFNKECKIYMKNRMFKFKKN